MPSVGGIIGQFGGIIVGLSFLAMAYLDKKGYQKSVEIYGIERAKKRYRLMKVFGFIITPAGVFYSIYSMF